jgi:lipopolysaccharide/colanic/teichoic acid biosynthesis glycosyltransferase
MIRLFNAVCACFGLVVLLPLFVVIAAAIAAEDRGRIFYRARRVGLHGNAFTLYKFRTMVVHADVLGPGITSSGDARVTRTGRVLRRYKVDEFPQLINVIRGEMNLVGPRPEDPRYTAAYDPVQAQILSVRPGITSPASLAYKDEESLLHGPEWEHNYIEKVMPAKLSIDLDYFKDNTLVSDIGVIVRTIAGVFHYAPRSKAAATLAMLCFIPLCLTPFLVHGQARILPLDYQLSARLGKLLYAKSSDIHTSVQPYELSDFRTVSAYDSLFQIGRAHGRTDSSWLQRKIFSEHLFESKDDTYRIVIDILPDATLGREMPQRRGTWSNTRDFFCEGAIGNELFFRTEYYESQTKFPSYLDAFIGKNFVIPGQGYKRLYGPESHDYGYATGFVSYSPSRYFNFQLGHGKNFFGDGYRSMLLSDIGFDYPYVKISTKFWKVKYVNLWAQFQDVGRTIHEFDTGFPKKYGVFHYLDINITERLSLGLFEAIIWKERDSTGYRGFDMNYLNPIIFFNPVEFSIGSPDNSLMAITLKYKLFGATALYGQLLIDELSAAEYVRNKGYWANKYAVQFGIKTFDPFAIRNLSLQTEFNMASPYTYSHFDPVSNYGHYNQSLAHPLGANFYESVSVAQFAVGRFEVRGQFTIARYGDDSAGVNLGRDIFKSYDTRLQDYGNYTGQGVSTRLYYGDLRVAYVVNPLTNLRIEAGGAYRRLTSSTGSEESMTVMLGVRSSFRNLYYDF